jgi:hypothetical protein
MASSTSATSPAAAPAATEAAAIAQVQPEKPSWREAREGAIRIQQRLRAEELARKSAQQDHKNKDERCIGGQRMKRVANGWVDAGAC